MRKVKGRQLVLLLAPGFLCFYFCVEYGSDVFNGPERKSSSSLQQNWANSKDNTINKTVVVIYSNQRSGSTFLGQTFNQNPNVFYLFEPLYPYTIKCDRLRSERIEVFKEISHCGFNNLQNAYREAFKITQSRDFECVDNAICFYRLHKPLLKKYAQTCEPGSLKFDRNSTTCGLPLRPDILTQTCLNSDFIVFKILRLCTLKMVDEVYEQLSRKGFNVYVIHLVRDPRAILSSRLQVHLDGMKEEQLPRESEHLCKRFQENLNYVEEIPSAGELPSSKVVSNGRYMRLRYEDVARDSLRYIEEIYRFIGWKLPFSVKHWIKKSQPDTNALTKLARKKALRIARRNKLEKGLESVIEDIDLSSNLDPFGTIQDPEEVLKKWRNFLTFDQVQTIQRRCEEPMKRLNYTPIQSPEEMLNFSKSFF